MTISGILGTSLFVTILIILFVLLLPVIAIIDIVVRHFPLAEKVIWTIIVLLVPILGSILYFVVSRRNKRMM